MPVIVVVPIVGRVRALLHFCTATRCDTTELQTTVTLSGQIDFGTRRVPNRPCADTLMPGSAQFSAEAGAEHSARNQPKPGGRELVRDRSLFRSSRHAARGRRL